MLFRIEADAALRPPEGTGAIVYLVSSVERVEDLALRYVFSTGHGLMRLSQWHDDPALLDSLDWEAITAQYWRPEADPDLSRRKQAEFLVHRFLPWEALLGIACLGETVAEAVRRRLAGVAPGGPPVVSRPSWYYGL